MPLAAAMLTADSDGPAAAPAAPCIVIPEPKAPPAPAAAAAEQRAKAATASQPASVPKQRRTPAKAAAAAAAKADAAARGQAKRKQQHHARKAATRSGDQGRTGRPPRKGPRSGRAQPSPKADGQQASGTGPRRRLAKAPHHRSQAHRPACGRSEATLPAIQAMRRTAEIGTHAAGGRPPRRSPAEPGKSCKPADICQ